MDVDAFAAGHGAEWARLAVLARKRRLSGAEADELLGLYQRVATHLSALRSEAPDAHLVGRLSVSLARARAAITAPRVPAWREATGFFTTRFPAAVYRMRWWWLGSAIGSILVALAYGWWISTHPGVQARLLPPEALRSLTGPGGQFEKYYSSAPASHFATQVWSHNAVVAAEALFFGVLLAVPTLWVLFQNALNLGVDGGLMSAAGRTDVFFGLILPHGLLELTAVFIAAGTGLKLGWTIIAPGARPRGAAVAEHGRVMAMMVLGLATMLAVSGVLEAFVTPSGWPTWVRVGVGVVVELGFLLYVFVVGRRAALEGETGDVGTADLADTLPYAA